MITFLAIAFALCCLVAWLLISPILSSDMARREKQKYAFFVLPAVLIFPLVFYLFIAR